MLKYIYGVMGSSKSAQALITKYNYEEKGFEVLLLKSYLDGKGEFIESRVGLKSKCNLFDEVSDLEIICHARTKSLKSIIIVDECQFCTKEQIDQLKKISYYYDVICYGLKTNIQGELFEGSKRLFEIADQFEEIFSVCECGCKASFNILIKDGKVCTDTSSSEYDFYKSACYDCWKKYTGGMFNER